jgi:hypothetical protein
MSSQNIYERKEQIGVREYQAHVEIDAVTIKP